MDLSLLFLYSFNYVIIAKSAMKEGDWMGKCLLRIILNEERNKKESTYKDIIQFLWLKGVSGVTVFRSDASLNSKGEVHYPILEDIYFNDLAIMIESVAEKNLIESFQDQLTELVGNGQILLLDEKEENGRMESNFYEVRVYTCTHEILFKKAEYEKVFNMLADAGVKWATMSKGIVGFGTEHKFKKQGPISFSTNQPIIIQCLVSKDNLEDVINKINDLITHGTISTVPVQVYINK